MLQRNEPMKKLTKVQRAKIYLEVASLVYNSDLGICAYLVDYCDYRQVLMEDTAQENFEEFALFKPRKNQRSSYLYWWIRDDRAIRQTCMLLCYEMTK